MVCNESQRELHIDSVRILVGPAGSLCHSGRGKVFVAVSDLFRMRRTSAGSSPGLEAHERVVDLREPT